VIEYGLMVWLKFIICAAIIFFAGSKLTRYGDVIAEKTGLSHAWIGVVLLAIITSLPELANGVSAAAFVKIPDLAFGDLLGACMVNMFTLAMLDIIWWLRGRESIFIGTKKSNIISTLFGVIILLTTSFALSLSRQIFDFSFFGISIYSFLILGIYFLTLRALRGHRTGEIVAEKEYEHISNFQTYFYFIILAGIVVAAGSWLPFIGNEIVSVMGWGKTFVAVLFIGIATTLPELTVSFSALRLGEVAMSIGNLVGSNIFNIAIIFMVDVFYQPASLFSAVSQSMIYAALSGALLMGIALVALERRIINRIPSLVIVLFYLLSLFLLFKAGVLS
jgi:cation:H+ antiporter